MNTKLCEDSGFILGIIVQAVKIIRWVIPILLIALITFDIFKMITGGADDKAKKEMSNRILQRVLYAIIIFLVPSIVNFVLLRIEPLSTDSNGEITTTSTSYLGCWNYYYNK